MRDASLDDFLGDEGGETPAAAGDTGDTEPAGEDIEPARPISTFVPGGRTCETCDEVVERLWYDDDAQVCRDCKDW